MSWVADNVSFALFSPTGGQPDALQPWIRIFGSSPQAFNQNAPGQPLNSQASGTIGEHQVVITAQVGRIDIVLSPATSVGPGPGSLGDVLLSLATLETYARKLIGVFGLLRVALIMNLSMPAVNAADATSKFMENTRLSVRKDATDLSFSLNIPTPFEGFGGNINRICRWGTGQVQVVTFGMLGFNSVQSPEVKTYYAATLQADINTVPQANPISIEKLPALMSKLTDEGRKIFHDAYKHVVEGA